MLRIFELTNYKTFKNKTELHMESIINYGAKKDTHLVCNTKINKTALIYGTLYSGKSSFLQGIRTLSTILYNNERTGDNIKTLYTPNYSCKNEPIILEGCYIVDNIQYRYGVEYNSERVLEEWLFKLDLSTAVDGETPDERLFAYEWNEEEQTYKYEIHENYKTRSPIVDCTLLFNQMLWDSNISKLYDVICSVIKFDNLITLRTEIEYYNKVFSPIVCDILNDMLNIECTKKEQTNGVWEKIDNNSGLERTITLITRILIGLYFNCIMLIDDIDSGIPTNVLRNVINLIKHHTKSSAQLIAVCNDNLMMKFEQPDTIFMINDKEELESLVDYTGANPLERQEKNNIPYRYLEHRYGYSAEYIMNDWEWSKIMEKITGGK